MAEADEKVLQDILTDEMLVAMSEALGQFAGLLDQTAAYAKQRSSEQKLTGGKELYWGGYIAGIQDSAALAREARPLRGIK